MFCNEQKINKMAKKTNLKTENKKRTSTKNIFWSKKCQYYTHTQKTHTDGIVQLILSSIELFHTESFVAYSKSRIFDKGLDFF